MINLEEELNALNSVDNFNNVEPQNQMNMSQVQSNNMNMNQMQSNNMNQPNNINLNQSMNNPQPIMTEVPTLVQTIQGDPSLDEAMESMEISYSPMKVTAGQSFNGGRSSLLKRLEGPQGAKFRIHFLTDSAVCCHTHSNPIKKASFICLGTFSKNGYMPDRCCDVYGMAKIRYNYPVAVIPINDGNISQIAPGAKPYYATLIMGYDRETKLGDALAITGSNILDIDFIGVVANEKFKQLDLTILPGKSVIATLPEYRNVIEEYNKIGNIDLDPKNYKNYLNLDGRIITREIYLKLYDDYVKPDDTGAGVQVAQMPVGTGNYESTTGYSQVMSPYGNNSNYGAQTGYIAQGSYNSQPYNNNLY